MRRLFFLVCFLFTVSVSVCFGGEKAHHSAYFDACTGHKYVKMDINTYAEYSKKGKFLKTVPADLPLLTNSSKIHPITQNSYILYEKASHGTSSQKLLPGLKYHPDGWKAQKLLVALN